MCHRMVLLIFAVIAAANLNTEANKEIKPLFTQEAIEIDGHLNEEAWVSDTSHRRLYATIP